MHIFRVSFFVFLFSLFTFSLFAQDKKDSTQIGSLKGKLVDAKNQPVSYATVTLLRADSSVANGDLSKDDGSFSIAPTGIGKFYLRIEYIGVASKTISIQITRDAPDKNLGNIKVAESDNKLADVDIVGEKPVVEMHVDKKVFNVEKNTTTAGGSASDVLQNVPSVSVDVDGNVSLRGKSDVTILIDGKPSTLLGTDVASALQSLPASSIESVEVITNPGAKYDAQGSSGIINIVTKKDGRFGINGNATLGAGTRDKYNGNLGLNVRKGKWSAFLNSSFRLNSSYNNVTTDRRDSNGQSFHTYENVPRNFNGYFNSIGVSFDPDKYNSISLTENLNIMDFRFKDYSDYIAYGGANETAPMLQEDRYSSQSGGPFSTSTAADYKHKFKKKDETLDIDATYAATTVSRAQYYSTTIDSFNAQGILLSPQSYYPVIENAPGTINNNTVNVSADYSDPLFTQNGKLALGFKSQIYTFGSSNNPVIDSTGRPSATDNNLAADFNYTQQIHAAYASWNDQVGKFSYQAGLRLEDAIYNGSGRTPLDNDTTVKNSYLDLFPSAFISYKLNDQENIYLNYSRRTDRPNFRQLLPFVDLSNPGTVNIGNPGLQPEFINNIEFSYSKADKKGNNLILSAYYAYNQNIIETIPNTLTATQAAQYGVLQSDLLSQPINIASGTTYGFDGTGHVQILPIWDATFNVNLYENQLVIGNADPGLTNSNGFTWFGKINTNLKLPGNFSFQVNANYMSPQIIAEGTLRQTYWIDMALKKSFWKNKATLIANCSDVFKTHTFITDYNLPSYTETINRVKETRIGTLTFTYRFGKSDVGKKRVRTDDKVTPPVDEDRSKNLKQGDDNDQGGGGQGGAPGGGGQGGAPGGGGQGGAPGGGGNGGGPGQGGGTPHAS